MTTSATQFAPHGAARPRQLFSPDSYLTWKLMSPSELVSVTGSLCGGFALDGKSARLTHSAVNLREARCYRGPRAGQQPGRRGRPPGRATGAWPAISVETGSVAALVVVVTQGREGRVGG